MDSRDLDAVPTVGDRILTRYGTEALVSFAAVGAAPAEVFASRGWTAGEWAAATGRLAAGGWVDSAGTATTRGKEGRDAVERLTDELAAAPWRALGPARAGRLAQLVMPIMLAVVNSGLLPATSTLGISRGRQPT